jgi:rhodanese-related sulfurtransferase
MTVRWSRLSMNRRLALAAFVLGLTAVFAQPYRGHAVTLDVQELATIVQSEGDHVRPGELAAWILEGRSDYRLVDLREEKEYAAYHVPTAENVPLAVLPDAVAADEKLVLYSEGGLHAVQAWMLLRAKGYRTVYSLQGGLEQWTDEVLFPALAPDASVQERARFERAAALARFFGGSPRAGSAPGVAAAAPELPKVEAPVLQAGGGAATPRRKKKEGC